MSKILINVFSSKPTILYINIQIFLLFYWFFCEFIGFIWEFTVKTTDHTVVS
jgi:hypothetical protein